MTKGEKTFWGVFALIVAVILGGALMWRTSHPATGTNETIGELLADASALPGIQTGQAPWDPGTATLAARLDAIGFPKMSMEGAVLHIHQHIDLFVHGKVVGIPAQIGIAGFFSPIHAHDITGIVHVESPVAATFYLGQFFDVWGVKLSADCIGGYCSDAKNSLHVYANGELFKGDPRTLELKAYEEIAIVYGTTAETPATIPAKYEFPKGY